MRSTDTAFSPHLGAVDRPLADHADVERVAVAAACARGQPPDPGRAVGARDEAVEIGRLELAAGGTVFLDEIAEMSPLVQAKLLRGGRGPRSGAGRVRAEGARRGRRQQVAGRRACSA